MYRLIWNLLPGPTYLKLIQSLLLISLVVLGCFWWLFPYLANILELTGNTVGS